ncbi:hypothetical protein [Sphingopyxis witflariensis]|uniref:hypothetical protein n=1 Tax=Sphingopyxis witflariensis TaxID=173675 RepID=UPI00118183C7|nr:hypothetical protein [Sphingopyxis witflariensis]
MRKLLTLTTFALAAACTQNWPEEGIEQSKGLLARGTAGLDCWDSGWMKARDRRHSPQLRDAHACLFPEKGIKLVHSDEKASSIGRCKAVSTTVEVSVTIFKSREASSYWGGYFCSIAQGDELNGMPIGAATDRSTALH